MLEGMPHSGVDLDHRLPEGFSTSQLGEEQPYLRV